MRKVMEHVLDKMDEEEGGDVVPANVQSTIPVEDRVRLYCLETELNADMDLRTVKHL